MIVIIHLNAVLVYKVLIKVDADRSKDHFEDEFI